MPLVELTDVVDQSFDYVIAGGGTAGLALAARLTEDPGTSVLVLEAGEENLNDPLILRTGQFGMHFGKPDYDWCLRTTPQEFANKVQFPWARGKVLGGSSAINFTSYTKPAKEEINAWELLGNEGWNWDNFDKYVERAVTYTPLQLSEAEHARRGTKPETRKIWEKQTGNGPVQLTHPPLRLDLDLKVEQTFNNLGIPIAPAPLGGNPNGTFWGVNTVDHKTLLRSYAANAYWTPNSSRPNFKLLTGALVHRVVSKDVSGQLVATGIEFSHKSTEGKSYVVNASKEVILSAGTLKTPQILELSGIGRPDVLNKINVPVKLALNGVGESMQDHIWAGVTFELKDGVPDETYDVLRDPESAARHLELFSKKEGIFTMGITNFVFAPLHSFSDRAGEIIANARREFEADFAAGKYSPALVEQYRILLDRLEKKIPTCELIGFPGLISFPNPPGPGKKYFTIVAGLNQMFSRGTIHAESSDPNVQPNVDPRYFEQEIDLKIFVEIVKFCRKVAQTAPFKDYLGETPVELNPGPNVQTDEQITEHLRAFSAATFHTIGTASMLPKEKNGVVDAKLKVYGTKNLRIADLSIIPLHFNSHSQFSAYGIGEKAADIIKGLA